MKKAKKRQFLYMGKTYEYELYTGGVKRINLRVRPDGSIRVSAPTLTPQRYIDTFLLRCGDRIAVAVARSQERGAPCVSPQTKAERAHSKERLLAMINECHARLVLPRFKALSLGLTEQQNAYITAPSAIRIREMKTRWGSCNAQKGTLNFNLRLLEVPVECLEYVVMHEFAHFVRPDHSPTYHALMDALLPDWRVRKKRLNGADRSQT